MATPDQSQSQQISLAPVQLWLTQAKAFDMDFDSNSGFDNSAAPIRSTIEVREKLENVLHQGHNKKVDKNDHLC